MNATTRMKLRCCVVGLLMASAGAVGSARAALLEGKVVTVDLIRQPTAGGPQAGASTAPFVVGTGVELTNFGETVSPILLPPLVNIDFSDRQILITLVMDQPLAFQERLQITGDPLTFPFFSNLTRVSVNPATNWAGFVPGRVVLGRVLSVNLSELSGLQGQQILLDVVPEPAAAGLMALAVGTVAATRRRRV